MSGGVILSLISALFSDCSRKVLLPHRSLTQPSTHPLTYSLTHLLGDSMTLSLLSLSLTLSLSLSLSHTHTHTHTHTPQTTAEPVMPDRLFEPGEQENSEQTQQIMEVEAADEEEEEEKELDETEKNGREEENKEESDERKKEEENDERENEENEEDTDERKKEEENEEKGEPDGREKEAEVGEREVGKGDTLEGDEEEEEEEEGKMVALSRGSRHPRTGMGTLLQITDNSTQNHGSLTLDLNLPWATLLDPLPEEQAPPTSADWAEATPTDTPTALLLPEYLALCRQHLSMSESELSFQTDLYGVIEERRDRGISWAELSGRGLLPLLPATGLTLTDHVQNLLNFEMVSENISTHTHTPSLSLSLSHTHRSSNWVPWKHNW